MTAQALARWDDQQAAYIADREGRFRALLDVLELTLGGAFVAIDLACGPGSLSARLLERFPAARVVGVDYDPLLLRVARRTLTRFGERLMLVDADLARRDWPAALEHALAGERPAAVVSTTALHWLPPHQLVRVYAQAAQLLTPGGVLLNGDHLRFDARSPTLRTVAAAHDQATQAAAFAAGAPTWDAWWQTLRAEPDAAALAAERDRRFAGRQGTPPTTLDFHLAALRQAGFAEVGTVWQLLDDYVVFGRLAEQSP